MWEEKMWITPLHLLWRRFTFTFIRSLRAINYSTYPSSLFTKPPIWIRSHLRRTQHTISTSWKEASPRMVALLYKWWERRMKRPQVMWQNTVRRVKVLGLYVRYNTYLLIDKGSFYIFFVRFHDFIAPCNYSCYLCCKRSNVLGFINRLNQ